MQQLNTHAAHNDTNVSLYDRHATTIFAYVYQQLANQQDAEDLLLEVFMAAFNNSALVGLTDAQQLAWLRRVAKNKVIDSYRHAAVLNIVPLEEFLNTEDEALTPEQRAIQQEQYEQLYYALQQLSPTQQQLIRLRYGNGLRLVEIAEMLHRPEGTIRKLLARVLRQLRTIYEQERKRI